MNFNGRLGRVILVAFGWVFLQSGAPGAAQEQATSVHDGSRAGQTFRIAGTVVSAMTGTPLSQARIFIVETKEAAKTTSMVTSESGHFEFSELNAAKYSLRGAKQGFISSAYDEHEGFSTAIVTGPEFATENLVLRLTPMAIIMGHVFDEAGAPIRNARLGLYLENHGGGMVRINRTGSATTDDRGFYDFSLLRPGKYYVSVTAKPWYAVHPATTSPTGVARANQVPASLDVAYPTTYYNGATDADSATPIEVKGGDRVQIDLHLNPVPALHLILRMPQVPPDGQNGFRMTTDLQKRVFDSVESVQPDGMHPVAQGVYELTGIPPGRYTMRSNNPNSGELEQSSEVDFVRDGQELNDSRGEPLGSLRLSLKMSGEETLPKQYTVALQDSKRRIVAAEQGDPSGQVTFEDLGPGEYAILITSPTKPCSVLRTSSQAGDSTGHEVSVTPGSALDMTAYLSAGVVSIEGVVQKSGKPIAGIMVALVPKDPEGHTELFRRDQSDFDGTFILKGVIPGSYTIFAVQDAWGFEWLQPGVLAGYVQHGQSVNISEAMQGAVHLPNPVEVQPR
jgi:hypothetical protein